MQRLSIFTCTVRAGVTALNTLFTQYDAQFILDWGNSYQLKIDDPTNFHALRMQQPSTLLRIPCTSQEWIYRLVVCSLTSAFSLELKDLADKWFISRVTLQNDMAKVREHL